MASMSSMTAASVGTNRIGEASIFGSPLSGRIAGPRQRRADPLAGFDHPVGFRLRGGVCAVVAVADALQELGKFPRLSVGESDLDLDGLHLRSPVDGGSPTLPPSTGEPEVHQAAVGRSGLQRA